MSEIEETLFVVTYRGKDHTVREEVRARFTTRRAADAFWAHLVLESEDFVPVKMERIALIKEA